MLWLEQDPAMPLGTSVAAGVILLREKEDGEEEFGREGDVSRGRSVEKALGCLIMCWMSASLQPHSVLVNRCRSPGRDLGCGGRSSSRGFDGGGLPWAALPRSGVGRGCQGVCWPGVCFWAWTSPGYPVSLGMVIAGCERANPSLLSRGRLQGVPNLLGDIRESTPLVAAGPCSLGN